MDLTQKKCVACEGGEKPLNQGQIQAFLKYLKTPWQVVDNKKIKKDFIFKDFKEAMAFVNKIAQIAENEGHHPDIYIFYNKVSIELWTHAINGLFENDFIVAAKIDKLLEKS